jgi:hypothetical protein
MFAGVSIYGRATKHEVRTVAPVLAVVIAAWGLMVVWPMRHDFTGFVYGWALMSAAMMVPTVLRPMQRIAMGQAARAWQFTLGYVIVWSLVSLPAWLVVSLGPTTSMAIALMWVATGTYMQLPAVLRSFHSCKAIKTSAQPLGAGARQGVACAVGCAPLMVMAMVTVMALSLPPLAVGAAMFAVMLLMVWQKSPSRSEVALRSVGLALIAAGAVLAVGGDFATHPHVT